jgi:DNA polymerase III epsilon subunit family exonuclease
MRTPVWQDFGPFTFFDIETTGMSPRRDRIVEIAAIRYGRDASCSEFQSLVDPGIPIPAFVSRIHRISDEMVAGAPSFAEVANKFLDFADGSTLVAHNAIFDLSFLQEGLLREKLPIWEGGTVDMLKIMRKNLPDLPSHSLANLAVCYGISFQDNAAHRAMNDVRVTAEIFAKFFQTLIDRRSDQNIQFSVKGLA